jgi:hypothetical protein
MAPDLLDHFGEDLVLVHLGRSEERLGERVLHNARIEPSNRQHATDSMRRTTRSMQYAAGSVPRPH